MKISRPAGRRRAALAVAAVTLSLCGAAALPSPVGAVPLSEATQLVTLPAPIVSVYGNSSARHPGDGAGGPGPAAANAAVADACNDGDPLADAQWYSLPSGDVDAAWVVRNGTQREDPDTVPARFAYVDADSLDVVACDAGPTEVSSSAPLLLAAWFTTAVPACDPEDWYVCGEQFVTYTLHRVSRDAPANDDWADATAITELPFTGTVDTSRATLDGPRREDWSRCLPWAVDLTETADVWFRYTAPADGTLRLAVSSSVPGYRPDIGITRLLPDGPAAPDPDAELDDCFPPATVTAGETYLIHVQDRFDRYYGESRPVGGPVTVSVTLDGDGPLPLGRPRDLTVGQGSATGEAVVRWYPATGGLSEGVTGYRVKVEGPNPRTLTLPSGTWTTTLTGLTPWTPHRITVRALRDGETGPAGSTFVYLPDALPGAPLSVAATAASRTATLTWKPPTHPGSTAITAYRLRRYTAKGHTLRQTVTVPADARSYTFDALYDGTAYTFDVTAVNADGPGTPTASGPVRRIRVPNPPTPGP